MLKKLKFDWEKTGTNNGHDVLEVELLGHKGEIKNVADNDLWSIRVDLVGQRKIGSEEYAKAEVERQITDKIQNRFQKTIKDLTLFETVLPAETMLQLKQEAINEALTSCHDHNEFNGDSELVLLEKQDVADTLIKTLPSAMLAGLATINMERTSPSNTVKIDEA